MFTFKYRLDLNFRFDDDVIKIRDSFIKFLSTNDYLKSYTHYTRGFSIRGKKSVDLPDSFFDYEDINFHNNIYSDSDKVTKFCSINSGSHSINLSFFWSEEAIKRIDSLIAFSREILMNIDKNFTPPLWGIFHSLSWVGDIREARPKRYHRHLMGNVIWEAFDKRISGTCDILSESILPEGSTKKKYGNYLEINWLSDCSKNIAHIAESRLNFLAERFDWIVRDDNSYGDVNVSSTPFKGFSIEKTIFLDFSLEENSLEEYIDSNIKQIEIHEGVRVDSREKALMLEKYIVSKKINNVYYRSTQRSSYYNPFPENRIGPVRKEPFKRKFSFDFRPLEYKSTRVTEKVHELIRVIDLPYLKKKKEVAFLGHISNLGLRREYVDEQKVNEWIAYNDNTRKVIKNLSADEIQLCLGICCKIREIEVAKALVREGADINKRSFDNNFPLLLAVESRDALIIKWLINLGASLDITDSSGNNVLHSIIGFTSIEMAYRMSYSDGLMRRRLEKLKDSYYQKKQIEIFDLLIEKGAKPLINKPNKAENTPFHIHSLNNNSADYTILKKMIHLGADLTIANGNALSIMEVFAFKGEIKLIKEINNIMIE